MIQNKDQNKYRTEQQQRSVSIIQSDPANRRQSFIDHDLFLSAEQIEKGLTDHHHHVREGVARTSQTLSPLQIERGLTDPDNHVRRRFSERKDFEPTSEQIDRGLNDNDWFVRYTFAMKENFIPTDSQISKIKLDLSLVVRDVYTKRAVEWQLKNEQQALHHQFLRQPATKIKKVL